MTPAEAATILHVGRGASVADIDRAFQRRARLSHPDRFAGATDAAIRVATAEFVRLIEARDLMRAVAPRPAPRHAPRPESANDAPDDPLAGGSLEPLSFEAFVQIRNARAWLTPSARPVGADPGDTPRVTAPRRAHHEWIVLPVVFVVLVSAIWGLTILLPG